MVVAECGTGKTLISLGAIHPHRQRSLFTALAMVPPHLVEKVGAGSVSDIARNTGVPDRRFAKWR